MTSHELANKLLSMEDIYIRAVGLDGSEPIINYAMYEYELTNEKYISLCYLTEQEININ